MPRLFPPHSADMECCILCTDGVMLPLCDGQYEHTTAALYYNYCEVILYSLMLQFLTRLVCTEFIRLYRRFRYGRCRSLQCTPSAMIILYYVTLLVSISPSLRPIYSVTMTCDAVNFSYYATMIKPFMYNIILCVCTCNISCKAMCCRSLLDNHNTYLYIIERVMTRR